VGRGWQRTTGLPDCFTQPGSPPEGFAIGKGHTACQGALDFPTEGRMFGPVLAPLLVALAAVLVIPSLQAEPTAALFVVEQQRSALVTRLAKPWSGALAVLSTDRRHIHGQLSGALWVLRADRLLAVTLAGEVEVIETVLVEDRQNARKPRALHKTLGDATVDLTDTPA
jgi:hypothetical protein